MLKIFKHLRKQDWLIIAIGVAFVWAAVQIELRIPGYMREITELVNTPGTEVSEIWTQGFWMLVMALLAMVMTVIVGYCAGKVAARFGRDLRIKIFGKVMDFGMAEISEFSIPSLITRTTNDVSQVEMIVTVGFMMLVRAPIMAFSATIRVFEQELDWAIAVIVAIAVLLFTILILVIFALPKFKIIPKLTDKLNLVAREHLSGIRVVKAYNAEEYEADRFEQANDKLMRTNRFSSRLMGILWPVIGVIMQGLPVAIFLIGANLINTQIDYADAAMATMNFAGVEYYITESLDLFANMMVFSQYAMQVVMSFLMMAMMLIFLPQAIVSAKRINEVLDKDELVKFPTTTTDATGDTNVAIEFKGVNFKYPEAEDYVLEDINFTVKGGETAAFIGATGAGKSTLLKLITRSYDVTDGELNVAGKNVKMYTEEELTTKIGYTLQKANLVSGSIGATIAFGHETSYALIGDIIEAARLAQATEFIEKLDDNYGSEIVQGATNVSGGQRQRLSIARTLFRKADILIFDDSFSALDYKTDRKLRKALATERTDVTKLIVAQRVSSIMDADKIVVLDEGRIAGVGTHQELLANCEVYQEIAKSQLTEEELANG